MPRSRVAVFRVFVYSFVLIDVLLLRPWVADNGYVAEPLYQPLFIARLLPFPTPTPTVVLVVKVLLLASAGVALTGRFARAAGIAVFILYTQWMVIAFSYGKVDHDRFGFLVALAVLPIAGRVRIRDEGSDESAGWSIKCVQAAVVATYFLAAIAKFRFGGFDWAEGATLTRAIIRRGTFLTDPLQENWQFLRIGQYLILLFELTAPMMLMRNALGRLWIGAAFAFHLITFASITILFWPHMICLSTFLPLERLQNVSFRPRSKPLGRRRVWSHG